jgi:phosphatidylglycerophosphatase A
LGKDNQRVVIDEVAGMCIALLWIPVQLPYLLFAFLLFRFFDIVKPLLIKKVEKLPGGLGVMLDDVLAGLNANLLLQLIVATNFLSNVHFY